MVACVGDVQVAAAVIGHALRIIESSKCAASVGETSEEAAPGVGRHVGLKVDLSDAMIFAIRDIQKAAAVGLDAKGAAESSGGAVAIDEVACGGRSACVQDHVVGGTVEVDAADRVVAFVCDVEIACGGYGHIVRIIKACGTTDAIGVSSSPYPCNRCHVAGSVDTTDAVVVGVGNIDIAVAGDDKTTRIVELRGGSRAIQKAGDACSRISCHVAERIDFSDGVVSVFGDVKVALGICGKAVRIA